VKVYLVQHGEAMSEEQDAERPLTDLGRQHAEWTGDLASKLGVQVYQIRHSGKTRARETAEIVSEALSPREGVVAVSGLGPLDDVEPVAEELDRASEPIMLVGHLPFMERLAGRLLTGDAGQPVIDFVNAGIVCLGRQDGRWQAMWIITPEIAEIRS
jgi:phosphohistidine phosphatase